MANSDIQGVNRSAVKERRLPPREDLNIPNPPYSAPTAGVSTPGGTFTKLLKPKITSRAVWTGSWQRGNRAISDRTNEISRAAVLKSKTGRWLFTQRSQKKRLWHRRLAVNVHNRTEWPMQDWCEPEWHRDESAGTWTILHRLRSMHGMGTELVETSSPGKWYYGNEWHEESRAVVMVKWTSRTIDTTEVALIFL